MDSGGAARKPGGVARLYISRREQLPWVILRLGRHRLALSAQHVREMAAMPLVIGMPGASPLLRGMIELRGEVLPLLDLRRLLGLPSLPSQMEKMDQALAQGEREHSKWLAGLEAAVAAEQPFTLPLDPDQCPFGRWCADFTTDDPVLISQMAALDASHRQVHQVAREVADWLRTGRGGQARELLQRHKGRTLSRLLQHMHALRRELVQQQREIAVVVDHPPSPPLALAVDEVEAVEKLVGGGGGLDQAELVPLNNRLLAGVDQRPADRGVVFLLDPERLVHQGQALAAQAG